MSCDFKPSDGFKTIEEEFEARTRKAFVDKKATEVWVNSRREGFRLAMCDYCITKGWMACELVEFDTQSSGQRYWLTDAGKKHFGL